MLRDIRWRHSISPHQHRLISHEHFKVNDKYQRERIYDIPNKIDIAVSPGWLVKISSHMNNRHSSENASPRDDRRRHDPNNGMNNIPNYESISVIYLFFS